MKRFLERELVTNNYNDGFNATVKSYYLLVGPGTIKVLSFVLKDTQFIDNILFAAIIETVGGTILPKLNVYGTLETIHTVDESTGIAYDYNGKEITWLPSGSSDIDVTVGSLKTKTIEVLNMGFKSMKVEVTTTEPTLDTELYKLTANGRSI